MNEVTSRFVPNLRPEQDNKVSGALAPPTKTKWWLFHKPIRSNFYPYKIWLAAE